MTDWLWEMKECAEQKERFESYRRDKEKFETKVEQDKRFNKKLRRVRNILKKIVLCLFFLNFKLAYCVNKVCWLKEQNKFDSRRKIRAVVIFKVTSS
jgi:hypothetical protein